MSRCFQVSLTLIRTSLVACLEILKAICQSSGTMSRSVRFSASYTHATLYLLDSQVCVTLAQRAGLTTWRCAKRLTTALSQARESKRQDMRLESPAATAMKTAFVRDCWIRRLLMVWPTDPKRFALLCVIKSNTAPM